MFKDLKDKRVLITGSTQGIGMATARAFARQGAKVGITSHVMSEGIEQSLAERLGAVVAIKHAAGGKGTLVISYGSLDELDGILAHIK